MDKKDVTKAQRWILADRLAEERLDLVNSRLEDVVPKKTIYGRFMKRVVDICVSGIAIVVTLPINVVIGFITLADVGRPLFFKQKRVGRNGKLFTLVKFRNMKNIFDDRGEPLPPEQRISKWGHFVRRTSLDELLNFYCVFKGNMSIIGPRPLVPEYTHRYNKRHLARLAVRPGLECPPRSKAESVWTWQEQFDNDVWYVENLSFKTDLMMLANLVRFAFDRDSKNARATSGRGSFMGYSLEGVAINMEDVPQSYVDELEGLDVNDKAGA